MYQIIRQLNGIYRAECHIQDGIEHDDFYTEDDAVKWLKAEAYVFNEIKIKRRHIDFLEEKVDARIVRRTVRQGDPL